VQELKPLLLGPFLPHEVILLVLLIGRGFGVHLIDAVKSSSGGRSYHGNAGRASFAFQWLLLLLLLLLSATGRTANSPWRQRGGRGGGKGFPSSSSSNPLATLPHPPPWPSSSVLPSLPSRSSFLLVFLLLDIAIKVTRGDEKVLKEDARGTEQPAVEDQDLIIDDGGEGEVTENFDEHGEGRLVVLIQALSLF